jgi:N-acetylglucosaminyldiphosphoundecaprenol N-acetyl-beta-D-mannosaminyltransferase
MSSEPTNPLRLPKTVVILGVPFHDVTMEETLAHIDEMIAAGRSRYLATANLDFAAQASQDVELQRILLEAHLVLCDGTPLIWASRWLKAPIRERVAGSDLMPELTAHCAKKGYRMFLLGATDQTLEMASEKMRADHPELVIAGSYAPPIAKLLNFDHDAILAKIHAAKPDVLIVCFGCPKQEKWIYMNLPRLEVPVSIGLGATLDFVAGNFKRAPVWMRKTGLEWVFRLGQEPRRLFNRYWIDLLFFVTGLRQQRATLAGNQSPRNSSPPVHTTASSPSNTTALVLKWTGRCDAARVAQKTLDTPLDNTGSALVLLDLAEVTYLDSTALGLLLRIYRENKNHGGEFALLAPSDAVTALLAAMKLNRLLPTVASVNDIRTRFDQQQKPAEASPYELHLEVEGDIIAGRCPGLQAWAEKAWSAQQSARSLHLNLQAVNFIDSSGLGLLLNLRRLVEGRPRGQLLLLNINANVHNVITMARMEKALNLPEDAS